MLLNLDPVEILNMIEPHFHDSTRACIRQFRFPSEHTHNDIADRPRLSGSRPHPANADFSSLLALPSRPRLGRTDSSHTCVSLAVAR
jgi:hypothetical protein